MLAAGATAWAQPVRVVQPLDVHLQESAAYDETLKNISPAELYFTCVWRAAGMARENRRLVLARIVRGDDATAIDEYPDEHPDQHPDRPRRPARPGGATNVATLRVEKVIGVTRFEPIEVRMSFRDSAALPEPDPDKLYLMQVITSASRADWGPGAEQEGPAIHQSLQEDPWDIVSMNSTVTLWATRQQMSLRTLAVPVPEPAEEWVEGFEAMLAASQAALDEDADPLTTLQRLLQRKHRSVRAMAALAACTNSVKLTAPDIRANAYAKLILAEPDPTVQRHLAKVYFNARADILPKDADLLARLLKVKDDETAEIITLGGLQFVKTRRKAIAETLKPLLAVGGDPVRQRHIMRALVHWAGADEMDILTDELAALARRETRTDAERMTQRLACAVLLYTAPDASEDLALDVCTAEPSAVMMSYLAKRKLYAAVPKLIQGVRDGKVPWTRPVRLAVAILTGRPEMTDFAKVDAWWKEVEADKAQARMVETGFAGVDREAEATAALADLQSDDFLRRRRAREQLRNIGLPLPKAITEATQSESPEVRLTARRLIDKAGEQQTALQEELEAAAGAALAELVDWPGGL